MSGKKQQSLFEAEPLPWELADGTDIECAQVVFDRPLEQAYSYLVPDELRGQVRPGQRVRVPFGRGNRAEVGFCVALTTPESAHRLKVLDSVIELARRGTKF